MTMTPGVQKLALTAHVVTSVGWLGAALAYAGLVLAALTGGDAHAMRVAYLAMSPLTWFAIVPLAVASLATGLVQSLGTEWGLFRHYWVLFKLALTAIAAIVLMSNTRTVADLTAMAKANEAIDVGGLQSQLIHSGGGAIVLLLATVLGVYKPRGLTKYGWRKQSTS